MPIRDAADYRSIAWVAMAIAVVAIQYCNPGLVVYLCPVGCYLAIACGTITHNHHHRPTFSKRSWNNAFGHLLSVFYGYPTIMWVPTHNLNHHKFVNRPGDATATWRYTNKHRLLVALTYPLVSGFFQSYPIKEYIADAKRRKPSLYARIRFQYTFWIGTYIGLGILAGLIYHRQQTGLGLYVWIGAVILPAITSTMTIMFFNYIQHVHTDAWSERDHSRNFTGKYFNFLFFNNGYHTVHHDHPAMHWSKLPEAHALVADSIDPRLNEPNLLTFMIRQYLLARVFPSLGTTQLRAAPSEGPPSDETKTSSDQKAA